MKNRSPHSADEVARSPSELELLQYELVANRRLAWDQMLWQMPATALAGQAFLFVIAFAPDASAAARLITSIMALVVSLASIASIGRFRISEVTDARFLLEFEDRFRGAPAFGPTWRDRRARTRRELLDGDERVSPLEWVTNKMGGIRGLLLWILCFLLFGVAALFVIALTILAPDVLAGGA